MEVKDLTEKERNEIVQRANFRAKFTTVPGKQIPIARKDSLLRNWLKRHKLVGKTQKGSGWVPVWERVYEGAGELQ